MWAIDVAEKMIIFDQQLEPWLPKSHANHKYVESAKGIPASAYYLIGSFSSDGDYHIAHITKCPVPSSALAENADEKTKLLDDEWISDNAERVLRILPGGINVIGLAWFSSKEVFEKQKNIISRSLARIQRMSNSLTTMGLESLDENLITVFVDNASAQPVGIIVDVVGKHPDSATKVTFKKSEAPRYLVQLEWVSLVSNASARIVFNVPLKKDSRSDFYNDFITACKAFATNLLTCETVLFDGVLREDNEPLFKDVKKRKKNTVEAQMFIDPLYNRENNTFSQTATNLHEVLFDIEVRASIPICSTIKDAKKALKYHLIRNVCSRAELHYESMEIVEDCPSIISVHQLPRPATTVLPTQAAILLSDFLFEADTVEDAQKNFEEMMDIQTSIEHVDEGWERALTEEELIAVRAPMDLQLVEYEASESCCTGRLILIIVCVVVAIISIIIYAVLSA